MKIGADVPVQIEPFLVPTMVSGRVGTTDSSKPAAAIDLPLSALDPYTLERLCREFRTGVFREAGKTPPPEAA